jgi:hypothetical protein
VKTVILCGAFGATLGDELRALGDERNRTVSGGDGVSRATRPLLALGPDGACPLDRWVAALSACPATSDLNDAFIVANKDNVNEFVAWSVGDGDGVRDENLANQKIHRGNVLCNDCALGDARAGPARDLLFAVETALGEDDHVLVIDGGRAPVPGFDLAGFLSRAEAAPGKDAVVRVDLSSGVGKSDPSDETLLDLAPAAPGSKRVAPVADITRVTPFDSGFKGLGSVNFASESKHAHALGAATLLRATTVPLLARFFDEAGDLEPARHSLGRFFFWLCKRKRVSAVRVARGDTFPLETPEDVDVADAFYRFYAEEEAKALQALEPKKNSRGPSLTSTTRRDAAAMFGTVAGEGDARKRMLADRFAAADKRCGDARARALEAALDMDVLLPTFFLSLEKTSASDASGAFVAIGPDGNTAKPLPTRFRDASQWNVSRNKPSQHPCYVTSAVSAYGKKPTFADMPIRWHGVDGEFTSRFAGNYADSGLVTTKVKSKVHASLE